MGSGTKSKKSKKTNWGSYYRSEYEYQAMVWCLKNDIRIGLLAAEPGTGPKRFFVEIEIGKKGHGKVKDSTLILLSKGETLKVKAKSNTKFLVISGKPINEEIARGGPFVMNTKAEILQAVQDYHNGTFVK